MFVLLMLFMATVRDYQHRGSVELAAASYSTFQSGAVKEDALKIVVTRDDNFFFDSKRVTPEQIPELIRKAVQQGSAPRVYLGIDGRAKYRTVNVLLDEIRMAKIENAVLLTN